MERIVDGQIYKEGETPWDLGSFVCVEVDGGKRHYSGLSVQERGRLGGHRSG